MAKCLCGCGQEVLEGKQYVNGGHYQRFRAAERKKGKVTKVDAELVEPQKENIEMDDKLIKAIGAVVRAEIMKVDKMDRRAAFVYTEKKGELPTDIGVFMHHDENREDKKDNLDNPISLDVKGTITEEQASKFNLINYGLSLLKLEPWNTKKEEIENIDGTKDYVIPMPLAQSMMLSEKHHSQSVNGRSSYKHIETVRAGAGWSKEQGIEAKVGGLMGVSQPMPKEALNPAYRKQDKK